MGITAKGGGERGSKGGGEEGREKEEDISHDDVVAATAGCQLRSGHIKKYQESLCKIPGNPRGAIYLYIANGKVGSQFSRVVK